MPYVRGNFLLGYLFRQRFQRQQIVSKGASNESTSISRKKVNGQKGLARRFDTAIHLHVSTNAVFQRMVWILATEALEARSLTFRGEQGCRDHFETASQEFGKVGEYCQAFSS